MSRSPAVEEVIRRLSLQTDPSTRDVAAAAREAGVVLSDVDVLEVLRLVQAERSGLGPLTELGRDAAVTDILVNGPREVYVDRGEGAQPVSVQFSDEAAVRRLAVRLVSAAGRRLDAAMPYADARLPDGTRLHAVIPPVSPRGTCLSLRFLRRRGLDLPGLVTLGSVSEQLAEVLDAVVSARLSFLVTGGTGSGKTTLLSALLGRADPRERVLLIEDSGELDPDLPHVVRLEARVANVEGAGEVGLRDLVRQSLRMRPDRVVVGEVRGPEVVDLLAALNTGHEGGAGTLHANSPDDVPARLEAMGSMAGLGREALHSQAASALHVVIHVERRPEGRRVSEVAVVERSPEGLVVCTPAVVAAVDAVRRGRGVGRFTALLGQRGCRPPVCLAGP